MNGGNGGGRGEREGGRAHTFPKSKNTEGKNSRKRLVLVNGGVKSGAWVTDLQKVRGGGINSKDLIA